MKFELHLQCITSKHEGRARMIVNLLSNAGQALRRFLPRPAPIVYGLSRISEEPRSRVTRNTCPHPLPAPPPPSVIFGTSGRPYRDYTYCRRFAVSIGVAGACVALESGSQVRREGGHVRGPLSRAKVWRTFRYYALVSCHVRCGARTGVLSSYMEPF